MKTKEQIKNRITELEKLNPKDTTELCYLKFALEHDKLSIKNLWCKYTLEVEEDNEILKVLK